MKKKRRVIKRKTALPSIEDLKGIANLHGMTTKEYVDYLAQRNRDHTGKRSKSASLDLGPEPWKTKRGSYDRVEKGIKKERK